MSTSTVKTVKRGPGRPKKSEYDANGNLIPKVVAVKAVPVVKKEKLTLPIVTRMGLALQASRSHVGTPNRTVFNLGSSIQAPTGNCQLASIQYFNQTLRFVNTTEELIHVLKCFSLISSKKIQFLDLNYIEANKLRKLLKDTNRIMIDEPYISTNNSRMAIFLVKVYGGKFGSEIDYDYMNKMKKIQDKQV